jgi:23S rRNA (cytosine1962-C5)-methyltransferase
MSFIRLFLKKNEEQRIKRGHLWIFSNEIEQTDDPVSDGDIVQVHDSKGHPLGYGFYNKHSLIAVRLLAPYFAGDISDYLSTSLLHAYNQRKLFYPDRNSFRFVFSESDFIPGLIIDKYNNSYVLQVYSAGIQKNIDSLIGILKDGYEVENIFTRNEPYFRKLEGLPEADLIYLGEQGEEIIDDGKIRYRINFVSSQKTGFYFDQCDNRDFTEKLVKGRTVLDGFCNSGGFGLHALFAGASSVVFADSSEAEINSVRINCTLNGFTSGFELVKGDVFDYLESCIGKSSRFDIVILDPPAFAKNKKNIPSAIKGYTKLNKLALQCIPNEGFLVTSSCSYHVKKDDFLAAVNISAEKAGRKIQLIYYNSASLDHPCLPAMEETSYLKFAVFSVLTL